MEPVKSIIHKAAFLVTVLAFLAALLGGVSLATAVIRSLIVYLITLLVISIAIKILRWNFLNSPKKNAANKQEAVQDSK
jgi:cytochrome b subunit of formate dehydrogenase